MRGAVFRALRALGSSLPLPVTITMLYPFAFARAVADAIRRPERRPPRAIPPGKTSGSRLAGIRLQTTAWLNTASLMWADQFTTRRWQGRIAGDIEGLRTIAAERPVIIVSLHFGAIFVMPALLRAHGIQTATVLGEALWPIRWWRLRRAQLTQLDGQPMHFRSGDARGLVRYLQPGHCLLVAADYPLGEQAAAGFGEGRISLSTPPLRLARLTGAAVVPVVARSEGVWRYAIRVGTPVPDDVVASGDYLAGVDHIARELLPIVAERPEQALPLLVRAFKSEATA